MIYLKLVLLLLLGNFVSGFRLELMYISLIENIRSSLTHLHGFQLLVLLPWFIGITFFYFYQKGKSSEYKVKFRPATNRCKSVLEAAKLAYANKIGVHHFPETWLSGLLANCQYCSLQR